MVLEAFPCSVCHSAFRAVHFPLVEEDHRTGLALRPVMLKLSGLLWHCSKWSRQSVLKILQYTPGLEMLACSIDPDLNYYTIYSNVILVYHFVYSRRTTSKQMRDLWESRSSKFYRGFAPFGSFPRLYTCTRWGLTASSRTLASIQQA